MIGYGETGIGSGPIANRDIYDAYKRGGTNIIDKLGGIIGYSTNTILTDFDSPASGDFNRWGAGTATTFEGAVDNGDSGGSWIVGQRLAAVPSFGSTDDQPYGSYSGATAVSPHNNWINETMGGVNWNSRAAGVTFHTSAAWGDGRVPDGGDVRFSLPTHSSGIPTIGLTQKTTVGHLTVVFGAHVFNTGGSSLNSTGRITVDGGGTMVVGGNGVIRSLGAVDSAYGLRVGNTGIGRFEQNGPTVDITQHLLIARLEASNGTYVLNSGNLVVRDGIMSVGNAGRGEFIQNDADSNVDAPTLAVGRGDGSDGTYRLNNGSVQADIAYVGQFSGATGEVIMNNGSLNLSGSLRIGSSGVGTFHQSGGTVDGVGTLRLGVEATSDGIYTVKGGVSRFDDVILVGQAGNGQLEIRNNASLSGLHMTVGAESGSMGVVQQDGSSSSVQIDGNLRLAVANNSTGSYELAGGTLDVSDGEISFGGGNGSFDFTGGTLHVGTYDGDLNNQGNGTLSPGNSAGLTTITGDYFQASTAALEIEIGGTIADSRFDVVNVGGMAELAGVLDVSLIGDFMPTAGQQFTVLTATSGVVDSGLVLGGAAAGLFDLLVSSSSVVLQAVSAALPGDYNGDGSINAADYTVWRDNLGSENPLVNDEIGGMVGEQHYDQWKQNFGRAGSSSTQASSAAVPEPSSLLLAAIAAVIAVAVTPRRRAALLVFLLATFGSLASNCDAAPKLDCDYNNDRICDAADYTVWRDTLGQIGGGLAADGSNDGVINHADYFVWKAGFGMVAGDGSESNPFLVSGGPSGATSVPEPASWMLIVIVLVSGFYWCRRHPVTL